MHSAPHPPLSALDLSMEGSALLTALRKALTDPTPTVFGLSAYALTMTILGGLALLLLAGLILRRAMNPESAAWVIRDPDGKIIGKLGSVKAKAGSGPLLLLARVLFVLTLIAGIGLIVYLWAAVPPNYRASAIVRVKSPSPAPPFQLDTAEPSQDLVDRYVRDQLVLLKDEGVLMGAVRALAVRETDWFQSRTGSGALEELKARLQVRQIPGTAYIEVAMTTATPEDAPIIVNTVVEKYLGKVESLVHRQYATELSDYEKQEALLSERLEQARRSRQQFVSSEMGTAGVTAGVNVVGQIWSVLAEKVTRLEAEKLQHKAAYENLVGISPSEIAISPQMRLMIQQDPQIQLVSDRIIGLQIERHLEVAEAATETAPSGSTQPADENARLALLDRQIATLQDLLDDMTAEKEKQVKDHAADVARTNYLDAIQAELQLRERMQEAEYKQRDLDRRLAHYRVLEQDEAQLREQLDQIQDYIHQLRLVIRDQNMVRVSRVGTAQRPERGEYRMHLRATLLVAMLVVVTALWPAFLRAGRATALTSEES